jgi:hypothetical protein
MRATYPVHLIPYTLPAILSCTPKSPEWYIFLTVSIWNIYIYQVCYSFPPLDLALLPTYSTSLNRPLTMLHENYKLYVMRLFFPSSQHKAYPRISHWVSHGFRAALKFWPPDVKYSVKLMWCFVFPPWHDNEAVPCKGKLFFFFQDFIDAGRVWRTRRLLLTRIFAGQTWSNSCWTV